MLTIFCLFQLVVNLAIVVYHALDYTHGEDEERLISPDLEGLITEMTAGNITGEYIFVIFGKIDLDSRSNENGKKTYLIEAKNKIQLLENSCISKG